MEIDGVSVVIATRGRPVLLRRAIRTIIEQDTDLPMEIIVVFDGIEIDVLADVDASANVAMRTIKNRQTPGLAGGRNTGIAAATYALVAFCDDDDEWKPKKISAQLALKEKDPAAAIIATGITIASSGGMHDRKSPERTEFQDLLKSRLTELHPSSFLVEKKLFQGALGLVDEEIPNSYAEDYDLLLRAAKLSHIAAVPDPLTIVHWDRASFFTEKWEGISNGLTYLLSKHPEFSGSQTGLARIEGQVAFALAAQNRRAEAKAWAKRSLKNDWKQIRALLAYSIVWRVLPAAPIVRTLNRFGKGV